MTDNINNNEFENNTNDYVSENNSETNTENIAESEIENEFTEPVTEVEEYVYTEPVQDTASYEWQSSEADTIIKDKVKKKEHKSGTGFRAFMVAILCVFTLSVVAMTAMVAGYLLNPENEKASLPAAGNASIVKNDNTDTNGEGGMKINISIPSVSADKSAYVAFDAKESEGKVLSIPEIAAKCTPSSVGIISEIPVNYSFGFGFSQSGTSTATGSGFVFSEQGYIITNHHVIEDAKKVTVIFHDKTELEAEIIGSDALSDIAVLKVNVPEGTTLVPMEIGNSDELVVGEAVVAIGCPAGIEFMGTVTDGIISSINRDVEITDNYGSVEKTMTLIQTNATINHGNSGGPLINTRGQVIGINTLKLTADYEGIGFSIPINGAMSIIKQLIEHGTVIERTDNDFAYTQGMIGITGAEITKDESEYYDIPQGVLVMQIDKDSSAAKAGLKRGDIITHYNGVKVHSIGEINEKKGSARAGETVSVTVYRGENESVDITFTLDAQS